MMKALVMKGVKIFLVIALAVLVVLLVAGAVFILGWPWWTAIFILMGILGLVIALVLVKRIWLRRREQRFVHQVVAQDEAYIKGIEATEKEPLRELQARWKEATDRLRRSHLRKYGNPLYVLPWYLVIGESGSGKTTAISSARLSSPFADVSRTSGISGTRNCDWWFFEQAVILDTAGRYAIPIDESLDKAEWQRFLNLLVKYRRKEPLNGLVVTIAADKLLQQDRETLEEDGRDIRRRIDEVMRVVGAKFPIHILVTKCDLVQGMTQFCDHLSEQRLDQPMGHVNQRLTKDVLSLTSEAIDTIAERLRDLRLLFLEKPPAEGVDPGFLIFPEEFEKLSPGLQAFVQAAFEENPYQETPIVRGIFFSSGRQEGSPYSHFLKALNLIDEREVLPGTSRGLFLHDIFAKVLPRDRELLAPTQRALEWQRLSRNLGLSAWIALGVAVCGIMSFSFLKNLATLRDVSRDLIRPPTVTGELGTDVTTLKGFRETILKVEQKNHDWWIPRFGLTESQRIETELKDTYSELFEKGFLAPFDRNMETRIADFSAKTPDETIGVYVDHATKRIDLLKARLDDESPDALRKRPQPFDELILGAIDCEIPDDMRSALGDLYFSSLAWRRTPADLHEETNALQAWLQRILTLEDKDLRWLVSWVNRQDDIPNVTLETFWQGSGRLPEKVVVLRAFTQAGKARLDGFLENVEAGLPDPTVIEARKKAFEKWYQENYLNAWYRFATDFPQGAKGLRTAAEWQKAAAQMVSDAGPYAVVLDTMASELEPMVGAGELPTWVKQLYRFQLTRVGIGEKPVSEDKGLLEKAKEVMVHIEQQVSKGTEKPWKFKESAVNSHDVYRKTLGQIAPATTSRRVCHDLAAQTFQDDPVTSDSPFHVAQRALKDWNKAVSAGEKTDRTVWRLVRGPFDSLWSFVVNETGCALQTAWEKDVLTKTEEVSPREAEKMVLGEDGLAWAFVDGPASPFVDQVPKKGFVAKRMFGRKILFDPAFLQTLSTGRKAIAGTQSGYDVTIKALPTGSKPDAATKPHETRLTLECQEGEQCMTNVNIPASQVFTWSPGTCEDVILEIDVGDVTLTKTYTGDGAFRTFLKDFQAGHRVFRPKDFPGRTEALKTMGIESITVRYGFKGHKPIITMPGPVTIPGKIAVCWNP